MAVSTKKADRPEIDVIALKQGEMTVYLRGVSPFYCNRVAEKAKRELLFPRGRLTTAQRATSLKHDPEDEYRKSPYLRREPGETRIMMRTEAFKKAIATAALRMPTAVAKTEINQLTYIVGDYAPIWGIPRLAMDIVRQADMSRTPDVRTRARIEHWATRIVVRWQEPMLNSDKVANLIAAAGVICGVGDWRQEKGGGSNGLFTIVSDDDPLLLEIIKTGGLEAQDEALANPVCADPEAEDLLAWYHEEFARRGISPARATEEEEDELPAAVLPNGHADEVVESAH